MQPNLPQIVIVGGGAGGIELAAMLGEKMGKSKQADILLIDTNPTHFWKPLLHEAAAGTLDSNEDEINYMACAINHNFKFSQGTMTGLKRAEKKIILAPILSDQNNEIIPQREISYDVLVMAVGSISNDFGIPGVKEYCYFLDNRVQADHFHKILLDKLMQLDYQDSQETFNVVVVGGGATGVELIAELHNAVRVISAYGSKIQPNLIHFTVIEAADRLLPALTQRLSDMIMNELKKLNVTIHLNEQVVKVTDQGFETKSGKFISADLKIWTAGIKAPEFLTHLDGLETNRINQLIVKQTLQTTKDDSIFAMGDCASCPQPNTTVSVPPRAAAAHQQAIFLVKSFKAYFTDKPLPLFYFYDRGSLVTLSRYKIVGNLMGKITKSLKIEGAIARFVYQYLYKQHLATLYGVWRVALLTIANSLSRKVKPRLKLH